VKRVGTFRAKPLAPRKELATRARQEDKNFYASKVWRNLRHCFLLRYPTCNTCAKHNIVTIATDVHHVIKRESRPDLALEWSNLEALCKSCHSRETGKGG
jgi:5-methylcytosine-specific restriction endonuclease McrA